MALLTTIVLGLVSIRLLPVSLIPDVDIPYITVQANAPDLSAREVDRTVMRPLCQQLMQMTSLEDISTESKDGVGTINMTFRHGSDIDFIFIEVNERIDRMMPSLRGIERPRVLKSGAADIPAFYINISLRNPHPAPEGSDSELFPVSEDFRKLSRFASEVITKRIEQLPEVAMADISGCTQDEILIIPDEEKLKAAGITQEEFESYVKSANVRLGNLTIRDGEYRYSVKFQSFAASRDNIADIFINAHGKLLQIKDIASLIEHPATRMGLVRSDGNDAITMAVVKQSDSKMSSLKKSISSLMEQFANDYPDVSFTVTRDQTRLLEYSINSLAGNIIVGILLACLVIFLFMKDFRSPALVALTMPAALIFAMLVFYLTHLSINIISLSGLILGVGMITDNTVVLIDNITARWQRGDNLKDAVLNGTKEVMGPMLSSVLTTVAVFIPLVFIKGIAGQMFSEQALAITIVLFTSYFITITIVPVYYWWWYKRSKSFRSNRFLEIFSLKGTILKYEIAETWLFRHSWVGWAIFAISAIGTLLCFSSMPKERLPRITYNDEILKIDWNSQISLEENSARIAEIEQLVKKDAIQITSMVGMQQFILEHSGENSISEALIYIRSKSAGTLERISESIRRHLSDYYPSAIFEFRESGNILEMVFAERNRTLESRLRPVSSTELQVEKVRKAVSDISLALPGTSIPEVITKKDLLYIADPEKMAIYGVSMNDLLNTLRNSLHGNRLFEIISGNESIPVVMGNGAQNPGDILETAVLHKPERDIPVKALMKTTYEEDFKSIFAGTEGNYYPINLDIPDKDAPGTMTAIKQALRKSGDFEVSFTGAWFNNREMAGELILVLIVALLLLYLILASQFESLVQPFIVLSEVVIDIFFSLAALKITGCTINLMSLLGLVVLCGIVINDSILKIDTINRLRKEGMKLEHAVMEAGVRRFKAIVMTSLTTILAVCPFLWRGSIGADLQFPMSVVIIAGMVAGTLVSLFFVPMLYLEFIRMKTGKRK